MNPTSQTSQAEAILNAVMARFATTVAASGTPGAGTPLCGVSAGPDLSEVRSRKLPWLTVELSDIARRRVTADGQVENDLSLDLIVNDAASPSGQGLLLAYRWTAWLESILILDAERQGGPALDGTVDWIEPDGIHLDVGGLGFSGFTVRIRFHLRYSTALGNPFTS